MYPCFHFWVDPGRFPHTMRGYKLDLSWRVYRTKMPFTQLAGEPDRDHLITKVRATRTLGREVIDRGPVLIPLIQSCFGISSNKRIEAGPLLMIKHSSLPPGFKPTPMTCLKAVWSRL